MKKITLIVGIVLAFSSISFDLNAQVNSTVNTTLSLKEQSIIGIAALTAKGEPTDGMTHVAIGTNTNIGGAVWTRPVTDEEYKYPN